MSPGLLAQTIEIDARIELPSPTGTHLHMGNPGPAGAELTLNNKYLSLGGEPIIPVMGEVHYSRVKRENWEDIILKMKANGINIIAFYAIWIHHEESESIFDWSGNKDLRAFVELCQKHDMWAYPRLGPWCHGEVRNGGLPDWLVKREDMKVRSNDPAYQHYAERWYQQIGQQLAGLYYKDGGPIIGVQLENEYWRGKGGEDHIMWLKQTAQRFGMDVPMYTVTGWRSASVPEGEAIPLWGGYPTAPWNTNLGKISRNESYVFRMPINSQAIGNKDNSDRYQPDYSLYPYFTCELGVGNQLSEHRRPVIDPMDGATIALSSIASGSNLPGYYVFAGGLNPVGKFTTLEEDQLESGYWNEYPDISYDFQAAIRETGEIAPSYHKVKPLHYFLNEFGDHLAPMQPIVPEGQEEPDDLKYSFRTDGASGFLFISNYYRGYTNSTKEDVQFTVQLQDEEITFPSKPVDIVDSAVFFWPVNMQMGEAILGCATVQPICQISNGEYQDWYFRQSGDIEVEFWLKGEAIEKLIVGGTSVAPVQRGSESYRLSGFPRDLTEPIIFTTDDGQTHRIFVLTNKQAEQFWYFQDAGQEYAFLSTANLYMDEHQQLHAFSTHEVDTIISLGRIEARGEKREILPSGFSRYTISYPSESIAIRLNPADLIDEAQWLSITAERQGGSRTLDHRQFFKNFSLEHSADIRRATFYFLGEAACKIRLNGRWVNQSVSADEVNKIDLTGYVQKGLNDLMLDFAYADTARAFAGVLEVEYYTSDKIQIATDSSWLTVQQYKIPAPWEDPRGKTQPTITERPYSPDHPGFSDARYALSFNQGTQKFENVFLRIDYKGDKAQLRIGERLVADNFNNGTTWSVNLRDMPMVYGEPLILEIQPLTEDTRLYTERELVRDWAELEIIEVEIEQKVIFELVPGE